MKLPVVLSSTALALAAEPVTAAFRVRLPPPAVRLTVLADTVLPMVIPPAAVVAEKAPPVRATAAEVVRAPPALRVRPPVPLLVTAALIARLL